MLPHLDFDLLAAHPKPFLGYSDITSLHVPIRQSAGFPTFYSYGLIGVGDKETTAFTRERLLRVLRGDVVGDVPRDPDDPYVRAIAPGKGERTARRRLPLAPAADPRDAVGARDRGHDPLLRGHDVPPYFIDGQLTQLGHAGKLDGIVGVVVGDMWRCDFGDLPREVYDWRATKSLEDVLDKHLAGLGVPVLYKLPLGHGKHLASIPLGVRVTLDADGRTLTVDESPFN